jgi:hypothetical protein
MPALTTVGVPVGSGRLKKTNPPSEDWLSPGAVAPDEVPQKNNKIRKKPNMIFEFKMNNVFNILIMFSFSLNLFFIYFILFWEKNKLDFDQIEVIPEIWISGFDMFSVSET